MMTKYDGNKDKRLSKQETLAMAYDIAEGRINERVVRLFWRDYGPKGEEGMVEEDKGEEKREISDEEL